MPSSSSTQPWESPLCPPPWIFAHQMEQKPRDHLQLNPASQVVEEFFCSGQSSVSLLPLAGTLVMSLWPRSDVVKQGYLGKLERNHRRYFVLRAGSHTGPSRLEWYKNEQKFTAMEKSGVKAALFGSSKQGLVKITILSGFAHTFKVFPFYLLVCFQVDLSEVLPGCEPDQQCPERPHSGAVCQGSHGGAGGSRPVGAGRLVPGGEEAD